MDDEIMTVKIKKPTHKALKMLAVQLETEVGSLADELIKCAIEQIQARPSPERRKAMCEMIDKLKHPEGGQRELEV